MKKSDLIRTLSNDLELPLPKSQEIVNKVFDTMAGALASGDRIEIRGFGSFSVRSHKGFIGRNPKTRVATTIAPKRLPFFRTGKDLAEAVNEEASRK